MIDRLCVLLIKEKFIAFGYDLYDEVPSVPRPVPPRPVEKRAKRTRRKIREGFGDEDLSDEELDVGHLPVTNPSYSRQLSLNSDRPTLRKTTTATEAQQEIHRARPIRGAKKMSASRDSYGLKPTATIPTDYEDDEETFEQQTQDLPMIVEPDEEDPLAGIDYAFTGDSTPPSQSDVEPPHTIPPAFGSLWIKRPATPLTEAFEEVDMDARYRAGVQSVSGRLPFLKRNMRAVFEHRAQRRRDLKASAAGYPEVGTRHLPKHGRLYDFRRVLDEESVKQNGDLPLRLSLLQADITIPRPKLDRGGQYIVNFQPPLRAASELLPFWSIPPPFTASGATVVITLSGFQGSGGRPLPWVLPGSASRPAGVGEKAEIHLEVVSGDETALFVSAKGKVVPLGWIEGRNLPQRESNSLITATLSLSWEFEPTGRCLPPPKSQRASHASLVMVEFRRNDHVWKTKQFGWRCPLCDRFGAFSDQFFLECHLQVHHELVESSIDEDAARMPRIVLTAHPLQRMATTPLPSSENAGSRARSPFSLEDDLSSASGSGIVRVERLTRAYGGLAEDAEMGSSSGLLAVRSTPAKQRPRKSITPPPTLDFVPNVNTAPEQNIDAARPAPPIIIDLTRESPEPAPRDPLGPAAVPKSGTYTSAYELSVFDILSELPLDVLGNQANRILEQQEKIYMRRELPVEDRVIAALWARWINLNRGKFLSSYVEGFKAFVQESHDVIRRAAGVRALRNFLLVMAQYRFLNPKELFEVTNISADTTVQKLHDFFSFCGKIDNIDHKEKTNSATIYFEKLSAAKTALMLNGGSLDGSNLTVASNVVSGNELHEEPEASGSGEQHVRQEDKPRSGIVAEYLAKGYELGEPILQRAIDMDKQNGISSRFLSYIKQFDKTIGSKISGPEETLSAKALNTGKAFDEKTHVVARANTYYEKAFASPLGQKVWAFYSSTSKQVVDIHEEARRIAEAHKSQRASGVASAQSTAAATDAPVSDVKAAI
ncbi:hypothetical protein FRC05_006114 [Tulasnella sp. 425]|nr:hypothetical protein FRC05_006114 [Tulasnella sp. 425]